MISRKLTNIVPCNAIIVDIVEHWKTRLRRLIDVKLSVVGLWNLLVSRLRPWIVWEADWLTIRWLNLLAICWPEPAVDVLWKQVFAAFATCRRELFVSFLISSRRIEFFSSFSYRWNRRDVPMSRYTEHPSLGSTWKWDCSPLASQSKRRPCSTRGRDYGLRASRRACWRVRALHRCRSSCDLCSWIVWHLGDEEKRWDEIELRQILLRAIREF